MIRRAKTRSCASVVVLLALIAFAVPMSEGQGGGAGRVLTLSGQVSVERERELWAVHPTDLIQPGQVIVTGPEGYALLQLDDGSRFEVFADSRVVFRANRGDWRDLIDIVLGKVKVHIEKLGGRPNPYRVNSATALIAVRGTTFEVGVLRDESTTVAVEEGVVAVTHKLLPTKEVLLTSGETLVVRPGEPLMPASVGKAGSVVVRGLEQVLQAMRLGGIRRAGQAPVSIPTSTPVPGSGPSTGDMGQAPPPAGTIPGDDTGPGATAPPSTTPAPPAAKPAPVPRTPPPPSVPIRKGSN
jgi:hypothetical protein